MDTRRKARIADGQAAVFRYGENKQEQVFKSIKGHPRLLFLLVCPVILILVVLAVSVNSLWVSSMELGLKRTEDADRSVLDAFNASSFETRMGSISSF